MKLKQATLILALPLAVLLAGTGCHRKDNVPLTKIPVHQAAPVGPETPQTIPDTAPITPAPAPVATPVTPMDHYPTSDIDLRQFDQDRPALAAYTVHFKFDSAVVETGEQANIASVAQALTDQNLKLLIEGHCDERGTDEYNRALGERRALALREALAKDGLDPMRVKTISFGKDKPVDTGHDESAWAKNRRGEFILLRPKTTATATP